MYCKYTQEFFLYCKLVIFLLFLFSFFLFCFVCPTIIVKGVPLKKPHQRTMTSWTSVNVFNCVPDIFCWCIAFLYSTFLWIELWIEIEFKPLNVCIGINIWMEAWRINKAFCMEQHPPPQLFLWIAWKFSNTLIADFLFKKMKALLQKHSYNHVLFLESLFFLPRNRVR